MRLRYFTIASLESNSPSSILMSIIWAPFSTCWRATSRAASYSPSRISRLNLAEPVTLVRSPTFMKPLVSSAMKGSSPESRITRGAVLSALVGWCLTRDAISTMWSGVVPQQPPTIFTSPEALYSATISAISTADKSYSPNWLGSPALGCAETCVSATAESSRRNGRSSAGPSAQFKPIDNGSACLTLCQNASVVCPDSVRPEASVIVPEIIISIRSPNFSETCAIA